MVRRNAPTSGTLPRLNADTSRVYGLGSSSVAQDNQAKRASRSLSSRHFIESFQVAMDNSLPERFDVGRGRELQRGNAAARFEPEREVGAEVPLSGELDA